MNYTTIDLVRKHVGGLQPSLRKIVNEPLRLVGFQETSLVWQPVVSGSEIVKSIIGHRPAKEMAVFAQDDKAQLNGRNIVERSVVVADSANLRHIYRENADYIVNCERGLLTRIATGEILPTASVCVWYFPHRIYNAAIDYRIDYEKGTIRRLAGGAIESEQSLLVDYQAKTDPVSDETIEIAIVESGSLMRSFVDIGKIDSADERLTAAHTFLAVSIVCRMKSFESIGVAGKPASGWGELARQYRDDAFELLDSFSRESAGHLGFGKKA